MPGTDAEAVTASVLRGWPLTEPGDDADKNERGRVVVVGGSREVPGSVLLAGLAALRGGAGKLQLATSRSAAVGLALAVPEARVVGLEEDADGAIDAGAAEAVAGLAAGAQAVVLGPGTSHPSAVHHLLAALAHRCRRGEGPAPTLVLDAGALGAIEPGRATDLLAPFGGRVVLTPNTHEMAQLPGCSRREVDAAPLAAAARMAAEWNVVVALKGATTYTAGPTGRSFGDAAGDAGLATSGSGDVLAGLIGGLAARGAGPLQATVWGVHAHARAGERLSRRIGPLGYLARELIDELPRVLAELAS